MKIDNHEVTVTSIDKRHTDLISILRVTLGKSSECSLSWFTKLFVELIFFENMDLSWKSHAGGWNDIFFQLVINNRQFSGGIQELNPTINNIHHLVWRIIFLCIPLNLLWTAGAINCATLPACYVFCNGYFHYICHLNTPVSMLLILMHWASVSNLISLYSVFCKQWWPI